MLWLLTAALGYCGQRWGKPAGDLSVQVCVSAAGVLKDSSGDTLRLPLVPFVHIIQGDLVACSLMWFLLGGWRNESYSVAFSEEECVI